MADFCPAGGDALEPAGLDTAMATDEPAVAATFDSMSISSSDAGGMALDIISAAAGGDEPLSALQQARLEWRAQIEQQPEVATRRAELGDMTNVETQSSIEPPLEVPPSCEEVNGNSSAELLEPPAVDMLKEWAVKMFNDSEGKVVDLPLLEHVFRENNGLIVNAKQAIFELFGTKAFKAALCCSPERPDLKLSQEEALGWLLAHARGTRLLEDIGKYAGTQATVAKKELDRIRDAAKVRRSKARSKGASAEAFAAIDKKVVQDRAAITEAPFQLKHMPAANTVIVERRVPKKPKPKPPAAPVDYIDAGESQVAFFAAERHPEISCYRGRPGGDEQERFWNPKEPPCVPSDDRPEHLFNTRAAAEAASAASQVEAWAPPPFEDEYYNDEER